jgi:hypothetical protein
MVKRSFGRQEVLRQFAEAVNMTPSELEQWLQTVESKSVGWRGRQGSESVGHRSGRRILSILAKESPELDDDDIAHMRKVVGFVRRHLAQRPGGDISKTRWRYSLMNWGHDPLT